MKLGVLVPHSSLYPSLAFDVVEGIRAGMATSGSTEVTLVVENIGFGLDSEQLRDKTQKLLLQDGVDVLVGMMNRRTVEAIAPLVAGANRLLLVLETLGEFFLDLPRHPSVLFHSLQFCLSTRLTARKAVQKGQKGVIQACSFYDAGYLQCYSLSQGVVPNGGHMVQYFVSSHKPQEVTFDALAAGMQSGEGQAVVALYSGDMASQFLQGYPSLPGRLPLCLGPMLLEESMLRDVPYSGLEAEGHTPWSVHLDTPENRDFITAMQRRGRQANLVSLLGYEAGQMMAFYEGLLQQTGYPTLEHASILAQYAFTGPRGQVAFDSETRYSFGPQYRATLAGTQAGYTQLSNLTEEPDWEQDRAMFLAEPLVGQHTGWNNIYLCI